MPRKLSEIKQYVPKSSLENIQDVPAKNSVMGNVKKLHDMLEEYESDFAARTLKANLNQILAAHNGELSEDIGDTGIEYLEGPLHTVYLSMAGNGVSSIQDKQKRDEMKKLIEYVAAGLDVTRNVPVTEQQKNDVQRMEAQGRPAVIKEQEEAEKQARWDAVAGKSALNVLDEYKSEIGALPKSFRGANAAMDEAIARQQLKEQCFNIMATRRAIEAKRNNKSGLAAATVNADLVHSIKQDMLKSQAMDDFFNSMSYKDLRDLAYSGHGGAMEEKFADYLKKDAKKIPADAPEHYMPTAKERTEALKDKMGSHSFKHATPGEQRKVYAELMATRAAVNSKRGKKDSLNFKVNPRILDEERKKFDEGPLKTALVRITAMGNKQEMAYDAATSGHGGALEDLMRIELRRMALEKESGYSMQNVDARYAPTFDQRRSDLSGLIDSGRLTTQEKFRAAVERGVLEEMSQKDNNTGETQIGNIPSVNRQTAMKVDLYSKFMDEASMQEFVADTGKLSFDQACSKFERAHMGQLKAYNLENKLNEDLAADPETVDLPKVAAQKMVLLKHKMQFQADKDNDKLASALDKDNLNKDVEKLMNDYNFKLMVKKLGTDGLKAYAKGDGTKLVESYALEKEDKLEPYKPEAPAPAKNNVKKDVQPGGPQVGGR